MRQQSATGDLTYSVHAAGIVEILPIADSVAALEDQWAVNVRGAYSLTAQALPFLRAGRGSVIFISSVAARIGIQDWTAYCATKGAIESLVRALAIEEAPNGVRVNAIAPGSVRTPMIEHLLVDPEVERAIIAQTPLGRIGTPQEIAPFAVLLASDAAAFLTGETIVVDGGLVSR